MAFPGKSDPQSKHLTEAKGFLTIAEPCHEEWELMDKREGGRHCEVCEKVVKDFTGQPREKILEVVQSHKPGEVCGRVNSSELSNPLTADVYFKFPKSRLRQFVLALVAVFGMQWFGLSKAEAQAVTTTAATPSAIQKPIPPDSIIEIGGIVSDSINPMPLEGVTVLIMKNGLPLAGAVTNSEGKFRIRIKAEKIKDEPFDVRITWLGRSMVFKSVNYDIREMAILIDSDYTLENIIISASRGRVTSGVMLGGIGYYDNMILVNDPGFKYYHELEDFIQMRSSEVHLNSRW